MGLEPNSFSSLVSETPPLKLQSLPDFQLTTNYSSFDKISQVLKNCKKAKVKKEQTVSFEIRLELEDLIEPKGS